MSYESLVRFFFTIHDPTTFAEQGADKGQQYSSVIFYSSESQQQTANSVMLELQKCIDTGRVDCFKEKEIATQVQEARQFYFAKLDHQSYFKKNPGATCGHRQWFKWEDLGI